MVNEIKALAKTHAEVYLATDPDREGEAIAWHLMEAAEIDPKLDAAGRISRDHRAGRQRRLRPPARASTWTWSTPSRPGVSWTAWWATSSARCCGARCASRLSAGRVQSVAVRLIVEREREIEAFVPVEYWSIGAELHPQA